MVPPAVTCNVFIYVLVCKYYSDKLCLRNQISEILVKEICSKSEHLPASSTILNIHGHTRTMEIGLYCNYQHLNFIKKMYGIY